jgi:hypothetical protein
MFVLFSFYAALTAVTFAPYALGNRLADRFQALAENATWPTLVDKVTHHAYAEIYGRFLLPHLQEVREVDNRGYRFLEIGAGCAIPHKKKGMQLWSKLFDRDDDVIYVAELKWRCIEKMKGYNTVPDRIKILIGDQGEKESLDRWIKDTDGGNFDSIVDDGSHKNTHIYTSLHALWPVLKPGGLYFLEDLQVGRHRDYQEDPAAALSGLSRDGSPAPLIMSEVLKDWQEQLIIPDAKQGEHYQYKVLPELKAIFCQMEACVLVKCGGGVGEAGAHSKCT